MGSKPSAATREFKTLAAAKFKAVKIDLNSFGPQWDQNRGISARMCATVMSKSKSQLEKSFGSDDEGAEAALAIVQVLTEELNYLKIHCEALNTAIARLAVILAKFEPPN